MIIMPKSVSRHIWSNHLCHFQYFLCVSLSVCLWIKTGRNHSTLSDVGVLSVVCPDSWLVLSVFTLYRCKVCVYVCAPVRSFVDHNVSNTPVVLAGSCHLLCLCVGHGTVASGARRASALFYVSARPAAARGLQEFVRGFTLAWPKSCLSLGISLARFHLDAVFPSVSIQWSMLTQILLSWLLETRKSPLILDKITPESFFFF